MYSLAFVSQQQIKFKPFRDALMDIPQLEEIQDAQNLSELIRIIQSSASVWDVVIVDLTTEITWEMSMSMIKFKMLFPNTALVALVDKTNINFILSCINYGATGLLLWNPNQSQVLAATVFQALERKGTPLSPSLAKLLISQFQYSKNLESQRA